MAKRRLSRQQLARIKTLQQRRRDRAAARAGGADADAALGPPRAGLVIANYGPAVVVEDLGAAAADPAVEPAGRRDAGLDDVDTYRCALRQNLPPAVCGDRLSWQPSGASEGVVVALEPRRTLLSKPDYGGRLKPVAANVDQAAVVVAPRPLPSESLIDRYLVVLESAGIDPLLVLNKADMAGADALRRERLELYATLGYPLISVSSRSGAGMAALRERLADRASVLLGQSGVGKSSLTAALLPDREIRVQALSRATGLGTHTTTTSLLYRLPGGGLLIDSPGVRSFEPYAVSDAELERGFVEFRPYLGACRFSDCAHDAEPGCALRAAVAAGAVSPRRLASYLQMAAANGAGGRRPDGDPVP